MALDRDLVLHSWCVQEEWNAPTIVGGRGAHFFDASGRSFLDMSSLAECASLGHQHPALVRAIHPWAPSSRGVLRHASTTAAGGSRKAARFRGWMDRHVLGTRTHAEFLRRLGVPAAEAGPGAEVIQ
jgi:hypothetical protein